MVETSKRFRRIDESGVKYRINPPVVPAQQREITTPPTSEITPASPADLMKPQLPEADIPAWMIPSSERNATNMVETNKPPTGQIPEAPIIVDEVKGKPQRGNRRKEPGQESFIPLGRRR